MYPPPPPPPPGGYPPPPPPPPGGYPPPPPPGYGYGYYYPPPPPPIVAGPEPKHGFANGVMVTAAVLSGMLLMLALSLDGSLDEGDSAVRLANKIVFLLLICGIAGVVDSIRAIYGRWKSALSVGLIHLILGLGLSVIGLLLQDAHNIRFSFGLLEVQILGGGLMVTGTLSLVAIGQVQAYGAWKRARQGLPPE